MKNLRMSCCGIFITMLMIIVRPGVSSAQGDFSYWKNLSREDSIAIDALLLYPKETRDAMLEASLYPEALVKLQSLQTRYNKSFAGLMSQYPKDEQEKYWNLVRYDGLVKKLSEGKKKSESEINEILKDYPAEIHETARSFGMRKYETLVKITGQSDAFNQAFQNFIKPYPLKTQEALTALVQLPEALSILQDNLSLVVLVGDVYRKNPDFVKHMADSLSLEVAKQNAEDVKQWSKTLEENPEAAEELKQSAKEYAKEYGYEEEDYTKPRDMDAVEIHHYYHPYPYWCGWPWWYPDYWWYPYPYWHHWGFYFSDGGIIVFGLPSYFFVSWYYHYPIHHYYYPHLTDAYIHTYQHYGPRRVSNTISHAVDDWRKEQEEKLPPGLLNDDAQRIGRLKQYGKFEEEYSRFNMVNPEKSLTRQEFFGKNENEFEQLDYPKKEIPKIQKDYPDDVYQRKQYPTKKEIENRTFEKNWTYPQKQEPVRRYYPDKKQEPQQKQVEPQRKIYPLNNAQPQKKFIPQKQVVPQQQIPRKQFQPKSDKMIRPKTGGR